jgi:hypothetical protein
MLEFELEDKSAAWIENNSIGNAEANSSSGIKESKGLRGSIVIEDSPKILVNLPLVSHPGSLRCGASIGEVS